MPKVTIIIPVYNVEDCLAECLDSVLSQTFQDIEVICIDDASTDHSMEILREYAYKDPRMAILQNDSNKMQAYARNRGLEKASGDYILFVDSDDCINKNLVMTVLNKADNVDMVCFDYKKVDKIWFGKDEHLFQLEEGAYKACDYFLRSVNRNSIVYSPCTKLYRRDFLIGENIKFIDGLLYEDVIFDFLCMMKAQKVYCIPEQLYEYRIRKNSTMTREISGKNVSDYFYILCYLTQYYLKYHFDAEMETAVEKYIQEMYRCFISSYRKYASGKDGYLIKKSMTDEISAKLYGLVAGYETHCSLVQMHIAEQIERIKEAGSILVYGAGAIARETIETLNRYDIAVDKIVVSERKNNRKSLLGNRVYGIIECVEERKNGLVIIATDAKFYPEIKKRLSELGFSNYIEVL